MLKHSGPGKATPQFSLIIPMFNEEAVLPLLVRRVRSLLDRLDGEAEAIFVDDGSSDASAIFVRGIASEEPRFRLIELSRNFGHQVAITAGMDAARGEAVVVMDADLQDPPEIVLDLIAKWREGYEIVCARRRRREGETYFKRLTANLFYRLLDKLTTVDIPHDVGDFRLIGRKALLTFRNMPERDRFVRGMFAWMGFKQTVILYDRPARVAGETKYPFWKMVRLAVHAVVSFSDKPLRLALWLGLSISGLAALFGAYAIASWLLKATVMDGWASIVVIVSLLSGINLFMTGLIGLYVGRIHAEVKGRPLYLIDRLTGFDAVADTSSGVLANSTLERRSG